MRQIAQWQKIPFCVFAQPSKHIHPFASASSASSSAAVIGTMEMNSASPCFSLLMLIVLASRICDSLKNTFLCGSRKKKTEKHKRTGHRTVIWGVDASKRSTYNMQDLCCGFAKSKPSFSSPFWCKMHFEPKCVFSLDLSPDRDSTRMVCAKNATM